MKLTRRGVRAMGIEQPHQLLGGLGGRHAAAGTGDDPGREHGSERITATTALAARVRPEGGGPRRTRWTAGLRVGTSVPGTRLPERRPGNRRENRAISSVDGAARTTRLR